jgi:hypothetical protein
MIAASTVITVITVIMAVMFASVELVSAQSGGGGGGGGGGSGGHSSSGSSSSSRRYYFGSSSCDRTCGLVAASFCGVVGAVILVGCVWAGLVNPCLFRRRQAREYPQLLAWVKRSLQEYENPEEHAKREGAFGPVYVPPGPTVRGLVQSPTAPPLSSSLIPVEGTALRLVVSSKYAVNGHSRALASLNPVTLMTFELTPGDNASTEGWKLTHSSVLPPEMGVEVPDSRIFPLNFIVFLNDRKVRRQMG